MDAKKLITGFMLGVVGCLSLSVSFSLAWYASSTRLQVKTINIETDNDRKLLISTSPELDTFKSSLVQGTDDIHAIDVYKPVSSMFSYTWMNEKKQTPEFRDSSSTENMHGIAIPQIWENGFYSQEFYLLSDDDLWVSIDPVKTKFLPDHTANVKAAKANKNKEIYKGLSEDEITQELDDLIYCLRCSLLLPDEDIYDYFILDPYKEGETKLGGLLDNMNDQYYDTYYDEESEQFYEIVYGETYNRDKMIYDEPTNIDVEPIGEYSAFNARIKGTAHHFNYEASVANGFSIKTEESLTYDDLQGLDTKIKIPVYKNEPRKVVLSVYLEGWDRQNVNTTMGASFLSDIAFKIVREM